MLSTTFECDYPGRTLPPWLAYYSYTRQEVDADLSHATLQIKLMSDHVVSAPPTTFHLGVPLPDKSERSVDLALSGRAGVTTMNGWHLYSCPVYLRRELQRRDAEGCKTRETDSTLVGVLIGKRNVKDGYVFSLPKNARKSKVPSSIQMGSTAMKRLLSRAELAATAPTAAAASTKG